MVSLLRTTSRRAFCTSTTGDSPVTVIVSSRPPTRISTGMVSVCEPVSSMPSRLTVLKPGSVNVSAYVPGRRSTMRYWPVPSVTAVRTFSMSAGLAASTVTPGSTPPDASRTVPVREAWANTDAGSSRTTRSVKHFTAVRIQRVFPFKLWTRAASRPRCHVRLRHYLFKGTCIQGGENYAAWSGKCQGIRHDL